MTDLFQFPTVAVRLCAKIIPISMIGFQPAFGILPSTAVYQQRGLWADSSGCIGEMYIAAVVY